MNLLNLRTSILAFITGLGPWLLVNATFVQLAALVALAGPSISGILAALIQIGTLAALAYTAWPPRMLPEWLIISASMALNLLAGGAMSVAWDHTVDLFGKDRPLVAMLAITASGCSGSLAVVQLYPLAGRGSHLCTASLSAGMGANGLVASLLALLLHDPRHYFIAITSVVFVSLLASLCLIMVLPSNADFSSPRTTTIPTTSTPSLNDTDALIEPPRIENNRWWIGWQVAAVQLCIASLNYSLISLTPFALPRLLRVASLAGAAIGSAARLAVVFIPILHLSIISIASFVLCILWILLFIAAIAPPTSTVLSWLVFTCFLFFQVFYAMQDTMLFLLAGKFLRAYRFQVIRLVGAGQQTGAAIGSIMGLIFSLLWIAS